MAGEKDEMAHLIISAAGTRTDEGMVLVIAVSGSEDGLARTGLSGSDFAIAQVPDVAHGVPAVRPVDRVIEGPDGCYSLLLAPATVAADGPAGREIFSVAVHGSTQSGWADEHGLTLAVSG
jgi:hypothetical protein